jgi:hypothetical protein
VRFHERTKRDYIREDRRDHRRGIAATKLIEQKVTEIRETSVPSVSSCSTVFEPRLSLNLAHFREDSSPETEALPPHFRRYAHTPTRRYDRLLWLRLRCVAIFCQKSVSCPHLRPHTSNRSASPNTTAPTKKDITVNPITRRKLMPAIARTGSAQNG